MPAELKHIKKYRYGRHRVYFSGHHSECSYAVWYVKMFKKSDVDAEAERSFHDKLRRALGEAQRALADPSPAAKAEPA